MKRWCGFMASVPPKEILSKKVIGFFKEKFSPKRDDWSSIQDFMLRRQDPKETVNWFTGDLRRKCHLLKRSEHILIERFVLGLSASPLRNGKVLWRFDDVISRYWGCHWKNSILTNLAWIRSIIRLQYKKEKKIQPKIEQEKLSLKNNAEEKPVHWKQIQ